MKNIGNATLQEHIQDVSNKCIALETKGGEGNSTRPNLHVNIDIDQDTK